MMKEIGSSPALKITRVIVIILLSGFFFSVGLLSDRAYASDDPPPGFTAISTAAELAAIGDTANNRSGNYWLADDIDISHMNWNAIGTFSAPFTGI